MCTNCDKILKKASKCGHFHCDQCQITFCMYCRLPITENHMNPFAEDSCCLFKIGAKKQTIASENFQDYENFNSSAQVRPPISRLLLVTLLLVWILFGLILLFFLVPYVTYHKIIYSRKHTTLQGSYLLAQATKHTPEPSHFGAWLLYLATVLATPLAVPFAYLFGIVYFLLACCGKRASGYEIINERTVHSELSVRRLERSF